MQFIEISQIEVRTRQRTIVPETVRALEESITAPKGLLHAIVIGSDERGLFLVAGEHRLRAVTNLHSASRPFTHGGQPVPLNTIPCITLSELSLADLMDAELDENIIRVDIPWQDRTRAIAAIHAQRQLQNPGQTVRDTAKELRSKAGLPEATSDSATRVAIRNATILAKHLNRPSVANARNATEAMGILLKEENAKLEAEHIKRKSAKAAAEPSPIVVHHGSLTDILPTLDDEIVDLICADLPYGIDAHKGGFRQRTVEHHNYDDSFQTARALMQTVIVEGWRVTKPRANLFIFGDIDLFPFFKECCARMGWKPFRTPIIWQKSESEGLAPWGREGFRRTYELIFFATKGGRGLIQSPTDVLRENRVSRALRRYGPEKPVGLMEQLIECSTMPGDMVLDPCCGSGSTLIAARHLRRKAIGIEIDEAAYNLSVVAAQRDPDETSAPTKPSASPAMEDIL